VTSNARGPSGDLVRIGQAHTPDKGRLKAQF